MADMDGVHEVDPDADVAARCKTGKPVLMVDLRVVDADMRDLPRGGSVTGEVVVRAPWLTPGYAGNPEGSEDLWRGGYLHTGDVGYLDEGGSLQITDRMKDVIKSGGEWLSSLAVPIQGPIRRWSQNRDSLRAQTDNAIRTNRVSQCTNSNPAHRK